MALIGYEWLILAGIIVIVLLWGPKKLPEIAKALGLAKKEFKKATEEPSPDQTRNEEQT